MGAPQESLPPSPLPEDLDDKKKLRSEYKRLPDDQKKEFITALINRVQDARRDEMFKELKEHFKGVDQLRKDIINFTITARKLQDGALKRKFLCPVDEEKKRREAIIKVVKKLHSSAVLGKNGKKDVLGRVQCAYDCLLAMQGLDDFKDFQKKAKKLETTLATLVEKPSAEQLCGFSDIAMLCLNHEQMKENKLILTYDMFEYFCEPYLGLMSDKDAVLRTCIARRDAVTGLKMPQPGDVVLAKKQWGDPNGRIARGIFVRIIEQLLLSIEGLNWAGVQQQYKEVLTMEEESGVKSLTGACIMEEYNGEIAAEMVAICWRIFMGHTSGTMEGKMPDLHEFENGRKGYYTYGGEFPRMRYSDKKTFYNKLSYIRRLMYTSKRYSWFLNVPIAPMFVCVLERAAAQPEFQQWSKCKASSYDDEDILLFFDAVEIHRNVGLEIEDGRSDAVSDDLAKIFQTPHKATSRKTMLQKKLSAVSLSGIAKFAWQHKWKIGGICIIAYAATVFGPPLYLSVTNHVTNSTAHGEAVIAAQYNATVRVLAPKIEAATGLSNKTIVRAGAALGTQVHNLDKWLHVIGPKIQRTPSRIRDKFKEIIRGKHPDLSDELVEYHANRATLDQFPIEIVNEKGDVIASYPVNTKVSDPKLRSLWGRRVGSSEIQQNASQLSASMTMPSSGGKNAVMPLGMEAPETSQDQLLIEWIANAKITAMNSDVSENLGNTGAAAANLVILSSVGVALEDTPEWPKEIQGLLNSQPEEWSKENEQRLLSLFPNKMREAAFAPIEYEPPVTRGSIKRRAETPTRPGGEAQRPRRETLSSKASYGHILDIVAPLSCDLGGLRL